MILASVLTTNLAILVLAGFIGFVVISKVPNTLHTPLMSGTNAIHGIVLLGGAAADRPGRQRRLQQGDPRDRDRLRHDQHRRRLPRHRPHARDVQVQAEAGAEGRRQGRAGRGRLVTRRSPPSSCRAKASSTSSTSSPSRLFIQGLRGLAGPTTAVRGNRIAAVGMAIAVDRHAAEPRRGQLGADRARRRARRGRRRARGAQVKMTAMPQMVALFNGVGGGAVCLIAWAEFRHHGSTYGSHTVHLSGHASARVTSRRACRPTSRSSRVFAAIVGSISFWGSNIAFGKLQEIIPGRPITLGAGQQIVNLVLLDAGARGRHRPRRRRALRSAVHRHADRRRAARQRRRAADRRRRHAGRDLAAERLHRPLGGGHRHRAEQPRADRRRHDRRRLGHDPHEPDGGRDEPLDPVDRRRRLRRRRRGRGRQRARASTRARCARRAPPTRRSSSPTPAAW